MAEVKAKRSWWRRAAWILVGIVVAVPVLAIAAILSLRTSPVQSYVLSIARDELTAAGVEVGKVSGQWPDEIIAEDITVSDEAGVWLSAGRARVIWSSWSLLGTTAAIESIELSQIHVLREPISTEPETESAPMSWPSLPLALDIKSLRGDGIIAAQIAGEEVALVFEGAGHLDGALLDAHLSAKQTNGSSDIKLELNSSSDLRKIKLIVDARDARLISGLSKDDSLKDVALRADLARDGDRWTGGLFAETSGYGEIEGEFTPDGFFRLSVPDTAKLATRFEVPVSGSFEALVRVLALDADGNANLEIFADTSKLKAEDELTAKLLQDGRVSGRVDLTSDGSLTVADIVAALGAGKLKATGTADLTSDNTIDADVSADIADLTLFSDAASGKANVHALIVGPTDAPAIAIDLTGTDIRQGELAWSTVTGKAQVDVQGLGEATITAEGAVPISIVAKLSQDGEVRVADVEGTALGADVKANARLEEAGPTGSAHISAKSLAPIGQFAGIPLSGSADINGTFASQNDQMRVDVKLTGKQIKLDTIVLSTVEATAKGPTSALDLNARASGSMDGEPLSFSTAAIFKSEAEQIQLQKLNVTQSETQAALSRPITISLKDGVAFEKAQIQLSRKKRLAGTIVASITQSAKGLAAEVSGSGLELRALTDNEMSGTAALNASFDGAGGVATATAEVKRLRARDSDTRVAPPLDIAAKANWKDGRATVEGSATGRNLKPATFRIATRMERAPDGGLPELAPGAPLDGQLLWSGRIGPLVAAFDLPGHTLDGDSDVNVAIKGTVGEPKMQGKASLKNGRYEGELTGTTLTDLSLTLDSDIATARVQLSAKDGGRGTIEGNISMDLGLGVGSTSGALTVKDALLVKRDDVTARLTGELRAVAGQGASGLRLEGKLTARDVMATLPKSLPPDVVVVDVIDPAAPPPKVDQAVKPNNSVPIELDLAVDIPGPATVSGRGLKSLWRGNLAVKGLVSAPAISGKLEAMRGGIDLAGETLESKRGIITFDGTTKIDPEIDIAFEGKSEDVETEIAIAGHASSIHVEARSTPPLPQDEVLARALFGKPSAELSAGEALALVQSIAELTGQTGGGYDLMSELQSSLGVDVLKVEGLTGSEGPTVTAGRYVSQDVYLGVRQGAKPGSTAATVEIEVTDELSAETDVGADASSAIGLNWKRDY